MRSSETVPGLRSGAKLNRTSHTSTANRGSLPAYGPPRLDIFQKTRGGILCRKSFDDILLRCVDRAEGEYIIDEAHSGICSASQLHRKAQLSGLEIARTAELFTALDRLLGIARRLCNGGQTWQASGAPVDFILCNRAVNSRAVVSGLITRLQRRWLDKESTGRIHSYASAANESDAIDSVVMLAKGFKRIPGSSLKGINWLSSPSWLWVMGERVILECLSASV
ncbi:unnamed protein product [Dovyalis caffra]|uniref:Uncharacterized protein n=1 Tax=Dovyalis caffra TaxID=77055 RepID=A0AAV1QTI1_9ROSI|nr:unnamed protein product [Dovyalis caffra]